MPNDASLDGAAGGQAGDAASHEGGAGTAGGGGMAGAGAAGGEGGAAGASGATGSCAALGTWHATEPFADGSHGSHPLPSFAAGSYYYVHTKALDGADDRILYSAWQNADGSLGPWQIGSMDHGGGPHGYTAITLDGVPYHFRNGHIARYDLTADGKMLGDVVLIEDNVDTAFGGNRFVWDTAVEVTFAGGARWVLHLGGFSMTPYAYRRDVFRNAIPPQPTFEDTGADHPAERPGRAALFAPSGAEWGYVFTGVAGGASLWRVRVHANGEVGAFESLPDLPSGTGNERGELFVAHQTLFAIRGSVVVRAPLSDTGDLGAWEPQPPLPEDQVDVTWGDGHLEGASHGILGDFVYVTGPKRVYYARIVTGQPCG